MTSHSSRVSGARRERIESSPQFNGRTFVNTRPIAQGFKEGVERPTLHAFLCEGERRTPSSPLPLVNPVERWKKPPVSGLRVTWLGHSTMLIEIDGVRLLTDPVWGPRASPLRFAGPKRFHPPPAPLAALPPLDAVIISHDHYDHLDRPTIRKLARMPVPFITSLGVGAHLETCGIPPERITELDWWDQSEVRGVTVTAAPAQHFSGRGIKNRNTTLWSSFHFQGPSHSFFDGADTGLTREYSDIARRLGPFDMVSLEIGAFHPAWGDIHLGPDNALAAYALLGSGLFLPIHWGTFNLAMHAWDEPAEVVFRRAPALGIPLVMPRLGDPVEPSHTEEPEPWWRSVASRGALESADEIGAIETEAPVEWMPD
jgi:L-ascorbate metabolism protein UlaG (beta-lactamase superfamily)